MDDHSRDACIALLKEKYSVLGRLPQKSDFTEAETAMIKSLLGPWPRALEKAGVISVFQTLTSKNITFGRIMENRIVFPANLKNFFPSRK